jgi:hypothetical protein
MARKAGQLSRADRAPGSFAFTFGRDPQTKRRKYHNQTIHGPFREAQRFLMNRLCSMAN